MAQYYENCYREVLEHVSYLPGNVPAHRKGAKHLYSFSENSFGEQLVIWEYIWNNTSDFWIKIHAFFFLEQNIKEIKALEQMWPVVVKWQDSVNDWGLCDAMAKIYTRILVVLPDKVYRVLKDWNKDNDPWKRRQSVVSLLYYSRTKKSYLSFDKIESLISPLLKDKEYYVQKGVGWTLRELNTVYPKKTKSYLIKNIKSISSMAFTIATEKMSQPDKSKLKALRKVPD